MEAVGDVLGLQDPVGIDWRHSLIFLPSPWTFTVTLAVLVCPWMEFFAGEDDDPRTPAFAALLSKPFDHVPSPLGAIRNAVGLLLRLFIEID